MKKAIYKITNEINKKIYIGQSINPEERLQSHCWKNERYPSLIGRAIKKYGKENFSLEVIGWYEDYNEQEKYWINFYKSINPNGYNIRSGGEEPPHYSGEAHSSSKINQITADNIIQDLLNFNIPRKTIVKKYRITQDMIRHIIEGKTWRKSNLNYPLRPQEKELNELKAKKVQEMLLNTTLSQKEIGQKVGWNRSAVTMINSGSNHWNKDLSYPIRR